MEPTHISNQIQDLFGGKGHAGIRGNYTIALRFGQLIRSIPEELEAGDIIIIPPSLVTKDYPSRGYIQGCIEKCWPQIKELKL